MDDQDASQDDPASETPRSGPSGPGVGGAAVEAGEVAGSGDQDLPAGRPDGAGEQDEPDEADDPDKPGEPDAAAEPVQRDGADEPDKPGEPGTAAGEVPPGEPGGGGSRAAWPWRRQPWGWPSAGARRQRRRDRPRAGWPAWRGRGRIALFALAGAIVALAVAGRVDAKVGPFDTTVSVSPSWTGDTVVRLAPLGTIGLDTHDWPLRIELRVDQLGLEDAERIAENPERVDQLGDDLADEVRAALVRLGLRCALLALVGGLAGALAARLSWRSAATGVAAGALVVVGVGAGTAATFDAEAVAEPRYSGLLTVAPTAVGDVQSIVDRFGEYRAQLSGLVTNIVTLYRVAEGLPTFEPTDGMVRLLHVSDIHLNPAAFDVISEVSDQFSVDAVVDTGDTTDWGTSTEEAIVDEIGRLDVPYVWVRGNHDSRQTQEAVARQPNATVLDGEATEVAGLRIWGIGDPRYTPNKEELSETETEQERADDYAPVVAERLAEDEPPEADIAMVHDRRTAADLGDEVPLVLAGHSHDPREDRLGDETLVLTEGSTGGAGLRGLQGTEPEPLTASILYFDPGTSELVAYDRITVLGAGRTGATIDRHVIADVREGEGSTTTTEPTAATTTTTTTG